MMKEVTSGVDFSLFFISLIIHLSSKF